MKTDHFQAQRFELKYRVSDSVAAQIRDFVGGYLEYDEYSRDCPGHAYLNHSLYLDSDDLRLYWDVVNGLKNRYKLRLRYYDDNPESPVFFEIKRRVNDAILKQRCPVRRAAVKTLLCGQLPAPEDLCSARSEAFAAIQEFCRLMADLNAAPKVHVSYRREAWADRDRNSVRVTLDHELCCAPRFTPELTTGIEGAVRPFARQFILELKFTARYPVWFRELVESFETTQSGCAKYAETIALLGEEHFRSAGYDPEHQRSLAPYLDRKREPVADTATRPAEFRHKS